MYKILKKVARDQCNCSCAGGTILQTTQCQPTEQHISQCISLVQTATDELRRSAYWNHVSETLQQQCPDIARRAVIVWGLGSLEQPGAYTIRCQLALALLLIENQHTSVEMYDPVFTPLDKAVLCRVCDCVIPEHSDGARIIDTPTLMYMPHCEADLTIRFLEINMTHGTLDNIVMIGNSLHEYHERCHLMGEGHEVLSHLMSHHKEYPLPELGFDCPGAFNNLSLHIFASSTSFPEE